MIYFTAGSYSQSEAKTIQLNYISGRGQESAFETELSTGHCLIKRGELQAHSEGESTQIAFDFLGEEGLKEIQAHFTSLCSAENYPNTLNLITEHMPEFYKAIIESC